MARTGRPVILLAMVAGWTAWSIVLITLYATLSIGCELGWQDLAAGPLSLLRLLLLVLWLVSVGLLALLSWFAWTRLHGMDDREQALSRFTGGMTIVGSMVACAATFWMGLPILGTSACI